MPPLKYHLAGDHGLTDGLYNATISGYGASVDSLFIGSTNLLPQDYAHSARIQTVGAGARSAGRAPGLVGALSGDPQRGGN